MAKQLTIGLDYDDTFTADPEFWREVIEVAKKHGHRVVCVTARFEDFDTTKAIREATGLLPICCNHNYKEEVCQKAGIKVDIWCDDNPDWIRPPRS